MSGPSFKRGIRQLQQAKRRVMAAALKQARSGSAHNINVSHHSNIQLAANAGQNQSVQDASSTQHVTIQQHSQEGSTVKGGNNRDGV
jgi:hypothetical protein